MSSPTDKTPDASPPGASAAAGADATSPAMRRRASDAAAATGAHAAQPGQTPRRRKTDFLPSGEPAPLSAHPTMAERAVWMVQRTHPAAWLWVSLAVIALDQATKFLATRFLELYERVVVLPVLDFTLLHNTGAAFSMLANASGWQRGFFITLGILVSLALIVWMFRMPRGEKLLPLALSLIVGGALGNVIDRIAHGYVIDFIHAHWGGAYFPAFNIADSAITIGAALLLLDAFREHPAAKADGAQ